VSLDLLLGCVALPLAYLGLMGVTMNLLAKKPDYSASRGYGESWDVHVFERFTWMGDSKTVESAYDVHVEE
jgi:hypothetical protein